MASVLHSSVSRFFRMSLTHVTALIWHQQITTSAITVHCSRNKVCYHIHEGFIWRLTIMWSVNQICSLWRNTGAGWCLPHSITLVYSSVQNNANNYSHGLHSLLHCVVAVMGISHFALELFQVRGNLNLALIIAAVIISKVTAVSLSIVGNTEVKPYLKNSVACRDKL